MDGGVMHARLCLVEVVVAASRFSEHVSDLAVLFRLDNRDHR